MRERRSPSMPFDSSIRTFPLIRIPAFFLRLPSQFVNSVPNCDVFAGRRHIQMGGQPVLSRNAADNCVSPKSISGRHNVRRLSKRAPKWKLERPSGMLAITDVISKYPIGMRRLTQWRKAGLPSWSGPGKLVLIRECDLREWMVAYYSGTVTQTRTA